MGRKCKKLIKNESGSIFIRTTIPAELADFAYESQKRGYTPNDWIRIGIRATLKGDAL